MNLTIRFTWTTKTPLRIHTGMARAGGVDRMVRMTGNKPVLPGEAVKATIREAAERILRWQKMNTLKESDKSSIPEHPALRRIFAPHAGSSSPARYFFRGSVASNGSGDPPIRKMEVTSTAIEKNTGVADDSMLRSIELWRPEIKFDIVVEGINGDWEAGKPDYADLNLLLMSITAADAIGGGWGVGCGELSISDLKYQVSSKAWAKVEFSDVVAFQASMEAIGKNPAPEVNS